MVTGFLKLLERRRWLPALIWAGAILAVSSLPDLDLAGPLFPGCDKVAHFIEYTILGLALRYWAGGLRVFHPAGGVIFAALDEFHQSYVPGREASLADFAADMGGLAVGFLLTGRLWRKRSDG
jgi:hypothetical protein